MRKLFRLLLRLVWTVLFTVLLVGSTLQIIDLADRVRLYTRQAEFDFLIWTIDSIVSKVQQMSLGSSAYLSETDRQTLVISSLQLTEKINRTKEELLDILGEPEHPDPETVAEPLREELDQLLRLQAGVQPIVESVLAEQVAYILSDIGLDVAGAVIPPVSFQITRPPLALIISPREEIRREVDVQLVPDLLLDDQIQLESRLEDELNISSLVVGTGGLSTYPTMIMESTSIQWLVEVITHEWVHIYLSVQPLGLRYNQTSALRTMNETTANLFGKAIGREVLIRYYPSHVPPPPPDTPPVPALPSEEPSFNFREEMRVTRVQVDQFLAEGQVEEAESYMEERRKVFWEEGYRIRRLNQAYFSFHGAYADQPGGAAGDDPVGEAVRELWDRLDSPVLFLQTMAGMRDFSELQEALMNTTR